MAGSKDKPMADDSLLSDEFLRQLMAVEEADLLVGIPTLNNSKTIAHVVQAVELGFAKFFPRERTVVVAADGGSHDDTEEVVRNANLGDPHRMRAPQSLRTMHRIATRYPGPVNSRNVLRTILAAADLVRAKACAVISPDLLSITPDWIESLLRPIYMEKYDLVTPLYLRRKFDGLLISNLVYPMVRAAYGLRLREPMAAEFAFSGKLASHLLEQGIAADQQSPHSVGIWVTSRAICGGFGVGQCFLGPKVQAPGNSSSDIVATISGVVGDLFRSLEREEEFWIRETGSRPLPAFGLPYDVNLEPLRVNRKQMIQMFRTGVVELKDILKTILREGTFAGLEGAADPRAESIPFPDELWVKTIYDFAGAFHRSVIHRDHILQALVPLYRGRVAAFTQELAGADETQVDAAIENLCLAYEQLKPYWIESWKIHQ